MLQAFYLLFTKDTHLISNSGTCQIPLICFPIHPYLYAAIKEDE
jgi:hypothetical protein